MLIHKYLRYQTDLGKTTSGLLDLCVNGSVQIYSKAFDFDLQISESEMI